MTVRDVVRCGTAASAAAAAAVVVAADTVVVVIAGDIAAAAVVVAAAAVAAAAAALYPSEDLTHRHYKTTCGCLDFALLLLLLHCHWRPQLERFAAQLEAPETAQR